MADDRRVDVIAVIGTSPGIGKSTLCAALVAHLRRLGLQVDHFDKADVLQRPQFARVAADFAANGRVSADVLVHAMLENLESSSDTDFDVVVADALMPFVPSLLAFGLNEAAIADTVNGLAKRIASIEATAVVTTVVVFLDGDACRGGGADAFVDRGSGRMGR